MKTYIWPHLTPLLSGSKLNLICDVRCAVQNSELPPINYLQMVPEQKTEFAVVLKYGPKLGAGARFCRWFLYRVLVTLF